MKCPVDKSVMMVVEHRRIELDYCHKCHGVWLDTGELELLISVLQAEGANLHPNELLTPEKAEIKDRRRCPICGQKMEKVRTGREHKVLIDRCPIGHGLWFDAGELQRVLRDMQPPGTPAAQDVVSFLGEAFHATHKQGAVK